MYIRYIYIYIYTVCYIPSNIKSSKVNTKFFFFFVLSIKDASRILMNVCIHVAIHISRLFGYSFQCVVIGEK